MTSVTPFQLDCLALATQRAADFTNIAQDAAVGIAPFDPDAAFQLASGLARYHHSRVLLVDMDHQSSLSIVSLTARIWQQTVQQNRTVSEIFKPFIGQSNSLPDRTIIETHAVKRVGNQHYQSLDIVPADS